MTEDIERLTWQTKANHTADPALKGADAFCAWPEELSESMRWGPTPEAALEAAKSDARRRLTSLDKLTRDRILTPLAQLGIKIPASLKQRIVDRADEAGMTLTRFVLEQCLNAPVVRPVAEGPKREEMETVLKAVLDRLASVERKLEQGSQQATSQR